MDSLNYKESDIFQILPIFILLATVTVLSSVLSLFLVKFLGEKKSIYCKLLRRICLAEAIFSFSAIWFLANKDVYNALVTLTKGIVIIDMSSLDDPKELFEKINISLSYSFQSYSLLLNLFLCLEMILSLRYPVAKMHNRVKIYLYSSLLVALSQFTILMFNQDLEHIIDGNGSDYKGNRTITARFYCEIIGVPMRAITLTAYFLFIVVGFVSIFYLVSRFCRGNSYAKKLRNEFVCKHVVYVITYSVLYFPVMYNYTLRILAKDSFLYPDYSILILLVHPSIMFFIRGSEVNFFAFRSCCSKGGEKGNHMSKTSPLINDGADLTSVQSSERKSEQSDGRTSRISSTKEFENEKEEMFFDENQPLMASIFKSLSFEFMCCILFGLKKIISAGDTHVKTKGRTTKTQQLKNSILGTSNENTTEIIVSDFDIDPGKEPNEAEFTRAKKHKVKYKKFSDEIEVEDISFKITEDPNNFGGRSGSIVLGSRSISDSEVDYLETNHKASIIEYCPRIFRELRYRDGITTELIQRSLDPVANKRNILNIKESSGKSGSFMFFTSDQNFMIKTLTDTELKTLLGKFMQGYYKHINRNDDSLLSRIYGVYEIIINGISKISVIFMQNLQIFPFNRVIRTFDLKGSTIGRKTKNYLSASPTTALKDLDFEGFLGKISSEMFEFEYDDLVSIFERLSKDTFFLKENKLMDYSLLLIIGEYPIESMQQDEKEMFESLMREKRKKYRVCISSNGKYIYCLGLIDYLQKFNLKKFIENKYLSILHGQDINKVSAVDPVIYSTRMISYLKDKLFRDN